MNKLALIFLAVAEIAFSQSASITFPVQYTVNRELSSSDALFGGIFFEVMPNRSELDILRRIVVFFDDVGGVEVEQAFTTSELFFRETYFEHVILRKKTDETQFQAVFEKFTTVDGDRRCAEFSLTLKETSSVVRLWACFDGEQYVIRRFSESLPVYDQSRVVVFDLVSQS